MTLTKAENWLKGFTAWFKWNAPTLDKKTLVTKLILLENFPYERMLFEITNGQHNYAGHTKG